MSKSGFSTPQRGGVAPGPRTISAKLANMKFMQRASPVSATPSVGDANTDSDFPSAKRVKTSHSTAASPASSTSVGLHAYGRGDSSNMSLGMNTSETMWTLPGAANEHAVKKAESGSSDEDDDDLPWQVGGTSSGRMQFGHLETKSKRVKQPPPSEAGKYKSTDEEEDSGSETLTKGREISAGARKFQEDNLARVLAASAERKRAVRETTAHLAKERKKREVKLNKT